MGDLAPFQFEDHEVRLITDDDGSTWWLGRDVCDALGLDRRALGRVTDRYRGARTTLTPGGPQEYVVLSEPGLYELVFRSNKPAAARFRAWVFEVVLPQLRAHGRVELGQELGRAGSRVDHLILSELVETHRRVQERLEASEAERRELLGMLQTAQERAFELAGARALAPEARTPRAAHARPTPPSAVEVVSTLAPFDGPTFYDDDDDDELLEDVRFRFHRQLVREVGCNELCHYFDALERRFGDRGSWSLSTVSGAIRFANEELGLSLVRRLILLGDS